MPDDDFIAFVEAMDQCWREGRFEDLHFFLAEDVVLVAPGGKQRVHGSRQAVDSYRQFMTHARVDFFSTENHVVTQRGDTTIVEYEWEMTWSAAGADHNDCGREVLVLARRGGEWRLVWRTQIAAG